LGSGAAFCVSQFVLGFETHRVLHEHAQVFTRIHQRIGVLLFGSLISDTKTYQSWTHFALLSKGKKTPQSISQI